MKSVIELYQALALEMTRRQKDNARSEREAEGKRHQQVRLPLERRAVPRPKAARDEAFEIRGAISMTDLRVIQFASSVALFFTLHRRKCITLSISFASSPSASASTLYFS